MHVLCFQIVRHCESLFYDCEWKGDSEECCDVLIPVFTEMGLCYSFNSKHAEKVWPWYEGFILGTISELPYLLPSVLKGEIPNVDR